MANLQSLAIQTLLSVAFTVLVLALIFTVAWWATGRRSRPFDLQRTFAAFARRGQRRGLTDDGAAEGTFGFVGRQREIQAFTDLVVGSDRRASRVLVVTGRSGMGKSALLNQFRFECKRRKIPCGPVVDLNLTRSIDEMLTSVVSSLEERLDGSGEPPFRKFEEALQIYR